MHRYFRHHLHFLLNIVSCRNKLNHRFFRFYVFYVFLFFFFIYVLWYDGFSPSVTRADSPGRERKSGITPCLWGERSLLLSICWSRCQLFIIVWCSVYVELLFSCKTSELSVSEWVPRGCGKDPRELKAVLRVKKKEAPTDHVLPLH